MTKIYFIGVIFFLILIPIYLAIKDSYCHDSFSYEDVPKLVVVICIIFSWPIVLLLIIPCLVLWILGVLIYRLTKYIYEKLQRNSREMS